MFDPLAMIIADHATKQHVLSARPTAPRVPERPPRQRGDAIRRLTGTALRRLADRIEPRCPDTCVRAA
ncbi:hypothetical protein K1T35_14585 [Pseudonocardia sp. DSM 110487]|uniref:hypothetical protein n=1 Tax=Pseudonocardia sp. DSM 110487 TaxID=2865833 RepID=UPI001C69E3CF|nr:hypothetical protein [Pseudonocardia sp. DSM 110487]QYN38336.1 hypothetical protein K1T35_14585 [Pseudonocardia sp. DSM 110487]